MNFRSSCYAKTQRCLFENPSPDALGNFWSINLIFGHSYTHSHGFHGKMLLNCPYMTGLAFTLRLLTVVQFWHFRIQSLELYPGVFSSEAPIHRQLTFVTLILPSFDFLSKCILIRDAATQTLTT